MSPLLLAMRECMPELMAGPKAAQPPGACVIMRYCAAEGCGGGASGKA